ncbi:hypothetical protein WOLCODRAFT_125019 [Wolfiporia cocos MD-104 SS10]|uniref:Uncharacterized protein n=1 Tax=Wolfiporia cocos (strain MD-104) TaxID=742152 RepID=A0A2H3IXU4_WOLCO|nr:hypothetical protein WOLCODRAFT_125019 [Wolfiporia cocos MD-104 SS10]
MVSNLVLAVGAVALSSMGGAFAVPVAATATVNPSCPALYTTTFTQTLFIIAPTTTGPFKTTTWTDTLTSYPVYATTEIGTSTFSGTVWENPGEIPTTTFYTTTWTEVYAYTNYYDNPPYPSDCVY